MRLVIILAASLSLAADWPQFLGPNRDSTSPETGLARTWPKDGPKLVWEKKAGSGWSGPVIAGDKVIMFHRIDGEEVIECVEAATGKEIWKAAYRTRYTDDFNFDDGPRSTPLITGNKVVTLGADGDLSVLDLTGKLLWRKNLTKDYMPPKGFFGIATSPIVVDGKLLINVGAKGAGVVAFDLDKGDELWKSTDHGVSYSSPTTAMIDGEEMAVFFTRLGLLVLSPKKGEVRYEFPWRPRINASVNAAAPLVMGSQIWISTSYSTGAILLEASKGELKELWKNDTSMSCHFNTPVRVKENLFGIDGRQESRAKLRCVDWKTGKILWNKDEFGCASLIAADGVILAMVETGDLVMFEESAKEYKELARAKILGEKVRASAALSGGRLFARDGSKWVAVDVKK
ncbi:MAG: PQQ-like beta-propeller repeat protein [Planctomycetes bacterium]|nr:PQQ-like beta-propeller repeat protein [Planctomycetota bacterium]